MRRTTIRNPLTSFLYDLRVRYVNGGTAYAAGGVGL